MEDESIDQNFKCSSAKQWHIVGVREQVPLDVKWKKSTNMVAVEVSFKGLVLFLYQGQSYSRSNCKEY